VLLLVVTFVSIVILVGVVVLVGVELLPLGAVGNEVSSVTALEVAPRRSPPLLVELPCKQRDLIIGDTLVLFIRSCGQRGQGKLQSR
jgi:hypothetical protein